MNPIKDLCTQETGTPTVLQGNIAFAAGCVRYGIHAVDGYPGTPSTEVIDKGLSQVQDMITVGWSVNEAAAVAMGHGHSLGGNDCVVTMKIPGLFQAGDPFASSAFFNDDRGALIYYIASDYTPSSTQHLVDPRPFIKSCFTPILEPRNHQEFHDAPEIAADLGRECNSPVVIMASGTLCHSEGLVRLSPIKKREKVELTVPLKTFNTLPGVARKNYDRVVTERLPKLLEIVEKSTLNRWDRGAGKVGVVTYGVSDLMVREVKQSLGENIDILSLGFTYPLPMKLIREFYESIDGTLYVIEDGYRYLQDEMLRQGMHVEGKSETETLTEWSPAEIAARVGYSIEQMETPSVQPLMRPPMICPGCPYRLFGEIVRKMKKRGKLESVFGDIGCNTLLYFMDAVDTNLCMGASEANRSGYVLANPEKASKVLSLLGDGTETHSGLDATRNALFRQVPGVKVILDNSWTAMTGGQPGPTSPVNLAGQKNSFDLQASLAAHGARVLVADGYDKKGVEQVLKDGLTAAAEGEFVTVVITGVCIRKMPKSAHGTKMQVDRELCVKCGMCQICPGILLDKEGAPHFNNNCSGCLSQAAACGQMCPKGAISPIAKQEGASVNARPALPVAPEGIELPNFAGLSLPEKIAVAIRGVGGQGNLFFGKVLTQMAFLAGYGETNVVKGETHGMAQMGGPVISTFSCGKVCSPVLLPGTADCLVTMEKSEILRQGFLDMLKPGGTVLMASTRVFPYGVDEDQYPTDQEIKDVLAGYKIVEVDVLAEALALGDASGRSANVVMMGALSKLAPFGDFPEELWLKALKNVSPKPAIWTANYAAFNAGKKLV
ncbi:2-oxoacid:acceptor oxidoreductase family protein [Desulfopila aestuarii]|uniref:Indolepyruvate ferredoxin oxidoreductase alpha subunit n=1 Tax=Desulfopila aestuarii DSM 18488 TaxID=1121416 RepID=A0A1M7XYB1_9BACT|nr:2-oxoacid:acceptor oxidoreductase family protein [Desulfopila aestuarii]SHO44010.1 indolepyruvate ferredoxin oxidoreductase alpha subunit [Desulfopila aestuarii DSM 18488]